MSLQHKLNEYLSTGEDNPTSIHLILKEQLHSERWTRIQNDYNIHSNTYLPFTSSELHAVGLEGNDTASRVDKVP